MITGITEPIEFTFLFAAPLFYVLHCILAGISFMFMHILNVTVGMTFSGGLIDLILFGVIQGNDKTNWVYIIIVGVFYFFIYYLLFSFLIKKFDWKTPGRESDLEKPKLYKRVDIEDIKNNDNNTYYKEVNLIIKGLGGKKNISDIDCCATRLRITVLDQNKVSDSILKSSGAAGIIKNGNGIQIVYGPKVTVIKSSLENYLKDPISDDIKKIKIEECTIYAPLKGILMKLEDIKDETFSNGNIGKGIAIDPVEGRVYAPFDGVIETIFPTKHVICLISDSGVELLIHIGINTVKLNGEHYTSYIKEGQKIKRGDLLLEFNINGIKGIGYSMITPIIVTNLNDYSSISITSKFSVNIGDELLFIKNN